MQFFIGIIVGAALGIFYMALMSSCGYVDAYENGAKNTEERFANASTIDAAPIVHGQIIQTIENGKMKRVFSCCDTDFTQMTMWITPNYCPNCGAKMEATE